MAPRDGFLTDGARTPAAAPSLLGVGLTLCLALCGCRVAESDCRALAEHVAELSAKEADGPAKEGGAGTELALEGDCKQLRPTRKLAQCMLAAQSLAELEGC